MTQTKNETSFKSLRAIVAQSSMSGNIVDAMCANFAHQNDPSDTSAQQNRLYHDTPVHAKVNSSLLRKIQKAPHLEFDFKPTGRMTVSLDVYAQPMVFDTTTLDDVVVEHLILACLDDKTVIGHDLYPSFALCRQHTDDWRPSCSLNLPSIHREFFQNMPITPGISPLSQLHKFTRTWCLGDALDVLLDMNERGNDAFFKVVELMPYAMCDVCAEAITRCDFEDNSTITFEAHLKAVFIERRASLMSSNQRQELLELDVCYLPPAHREFQLVVASVTNALTSAREAK